MRKKTICLITDWYPTPDNPYRGSFFKEQAFAVADSFDFVIVHYKELVKKKPGKKYICREINKERNTKEYSLDLFIPLQMFMRDITYDQKRRHTAGVEEGVGKYVSPQRKKYVRDNIIKAFNNNIGNDFDALYCVDAQREAYAVSCVAWEFGKPYILGEHGVVPWPGTVITDTNKHAIENGNLFLAISNDKVRQMMLQNIKLPPIVYMGNLIDEQQFTIQKNKKDDIKTITIVASNSFYKNFDMFIDVMERLTKIADKPFKVLVAGYGANKGYAKNIDSLENKLRSSAFSDRLELIASVPRDRIASIYQRSDAFVMTSIQEGQPVSAMEAACCGLPIFSTKCGGVEDYVTDEIGRLYGITDSEGMAEGLNDFLNGEICFDPESIRNIVVNLFGRKAFTNKFTETFMSVI